MDPGLTLETAKKRVRQSKAVKDQSRHLRKEIKDHATLGGLKVMQNWTK